MWPKAGQSLLSFAPTIQNEGPGLDCSQTPGPRCAVPWQAIVQALYACRPRVLSSAWGMSGVGDAVAGELSALPLSALRRAGAHLRSL